MPPRIVEILKTHRITVIVVIWALVAWGLQVLWLLWDLGPPESDEWHQLTKAEMLLAGWQASGPRGMLDALAGIHTAYPPLIFLGAQPAFWLAGGYSTEAANLSITPWLVVLICATYGIVRRPLGDGAGLAAAFLVSALPMVISLSRKFLLDFPLAATVTLTLWALMRSDRLRNPVWVWVSGLLFGLALLGKFIAGVFLMGAYLWLVAVPLVVTLRRWPIRTVAVAVPVVALAVWLGLDALGWYREVVAFGVIDGGGNSDVWMERLARNRYFGLLWSLLLLASVGLVLLARRVRHEAPRGLLALGAAVLAAGWLAGSWYLPHIHEVVLVVKGFATEAGIEEGDPGMGSVAGWLYYPWALTRAMPQAWSLLTVVGIGLSLAHPRLRKPLAPLLFSLAVALAVMNLTANRELRYAVSLSPFLAVFATGWAIVLPTLHRRLVWGTVIAMAITFSVGWIPIAADLWRPHPALVWKQDRVVSSGRTFTDFVIPESLGPEDVVRIPEFYVIAPLPRHMPYEDGDLPFGNPGP